MLKKAMMLAVLMLGLLACPTNVPLSAFNTSCVHDSDCIVVQVGDACACGCGNAAINAADQNAYASLFAARRKDCQAATDCDFCFSSADGGPNAVCMQGQCAFEP
jgi:hypothetical protein